MLLDMHVRTPADLPTVAQRLLQERPRILALVGPLGAGKTSLTQALAQAMGVVEHVTSPTYVLQQIYRASHPSYDTLVHVDAYRVRGEHELPALDLQHWTQRPKTLVVIEWADRLAEYLKPLAPVWVRFTVRKSGERDVEVSSPSG